MQEPQAQRIHDEDRALLVSLQTASASVHSDALLRVDIIISACWTVGDSLSTVLLCLKCVCTSCTEDKGMQQREAEEAD